MLRANRTKRSWGTKFEKLDSVWHVDGRSDPPRSDDPPEVPMSRLPVNASSEASARRIAEHAAKTQVPEGMTMTVGNLVAVEPGRPFAEVALAERYITGVPQQTYVFEVAIERVELVVDAEGRPTLASLRILNRPRYDSLVKLAGWLRHGAYPSSYTFEQALGEHIERGIINAEDAAFLRLIEAERNS